MVNKEQKTKYICEKLGWQWHEADLIFRHKNIICADECRCVCVFVGESEIFTDHIKQSNPDFTSHTGSAELLIRLRGSKYWIDFIMSTHSCLIPLEYIRVDYITEPEGGESLLNAVYDWFKEKRQ